MSNTQFHRPIEMQRAIVRLQCSGCGAEANATCNCGKAYMPAKIRAADAIKANPEKSNRAIASEIGVDEGTVRAARGQTAEYSAVDERIGLDGKTRRMPARQEYSDDDDSNVETDVEPDNRRSAFLLRADQARQFAIYSGPIDGDVYEAAKSAAAMWKNLELELQRKLGG